MHLALQPPHWSTMHIAAGPHFLDLQGLLPEQLVSLSPFWQRMLEAKSPNDGPAAAAPPAGAAAAAAAAVALATCSAPPAVPLAMDWRFFWSCWCKARGAKRGPGGEC